MTWPQVDCQHRPRQRLCDLSIPLPFTAALVGLSLNGEEMEVFSVINSKAKGLSAMPCSTIHEAQLAESLAQERPELFIALQLNELSRSLPGSVV